ncbi:MAG: DUF2225 domain-containing protein [Chitinispirillales bacterium]|jgi:diguanylate cyclase (GGDEF)-like protein|nr:DUF2225 domain-containing protein [Chitinispirillales bacterium]
MKIKAKIRNKILLSGITVSVLCTLAMVISGYFIFRGGVDFCRSLPAFIISAAAAVSGSAILSAWFSRLIAKPVQNFVRETAKLKEGDFERRVSVESSDEIGALAETFNIMADRLSDCMQNIVSLSHTQNELELAANTDQLTGVYNRRYFMETAVKRLEAISKSGIRMYAVLFDLDHFKKINDTYGHPAGDEVLRVVAKTVKMSVRPVDLFARYGGEEFILLVGNMSRTVTLELLNRIREKICAAPIEFENQTIPVSASFGFATISPRNDISEAIANADLALYKAKSEGRNRVVYYEPEESGISINPEDMKDIGAVVKFHKNQTVFAQNDAGSEMYIVLQGSFGVYINLFTGFPARTRGIRCGSFFGDMSLIDGSPRSATIIAEEESLVLAVSKDNFEKLLARSPEIAAEVYNTLKARADSAAEEVRDSGKKISEPPQAEKSENAGHNLRAMVELARYLRQMNDLLATPHDAKAAPNETENEDKASKGTVTLLPNGFIPFNPDEYDEYDTAYFLQQKRLVCPYCDITTDAAVPLFSNLVKIDTNLDGRVIYHKFDILRYTNVVCPNCNYTDTYQEFGMQLLKDSKPKFVGSRFINTERFTGYANANLHTLNEAVMSYYQNIECLRRVTNDSLRIAKAWSRLYWIYSDHKREEYAAHAAGRAYYFYSKYAGRHDGEIGTENKIRVNAILGELAAATGNYKQALKHFQENLGSEKRENQNIVQRCEERLMEIKKIL